MNEKELRLVLQFVKDAYHIEKEADAFAAPEFLEHAAVAIHLLEEELDMYDKD